MTRRERTKIELLLLVAEGSEVGGKWWEPPQLKTATVRCESLGRNVTYVSTRAAKALRDLVSDGFVESAVVELGKPLPPRRTFSRRAGRQYWHWCRITEAGQKRVAYVLEEIRHGEFYGLRHA